MLSKILSKSDCASCRFCCSFRRQSLWETPLFSPGEAARLSEKFPSARFRPAGKSSVTIDLSDAYETGDPEEEAPCPFLAPDAGCVLSADEKPFDCSIWPLRAVRLPGGEIRVALTPTCPAVGKVPLDSVRSLVASVLGERIAAEVRENGDMVKDWRDFFVILD